MIHSLRRSALFLLLLCLGCSAQSNGPTDVNRKVERLIRGHFSIPPSVDVRVTARKPSPDFSGYDVVTLTLSRADRTTTHDFLISRDNARLLQMVPIDDPMDKIDLTGRPSRGNRDAKVVIVNYDDFQCPFCSRNHQELMQDILKQYGDRIRIVYKDYALPELHPWATHAAIDANCLAAQNTDAYWDFADYVHANQEAITGPRLTFDDKATLAQKKEALDKALNQSFTRLDMIAQDTGQKRSLDAGKLQACVKAQKDDAVKASRQEGDDLGVSATPTMFINGAKYDGAVPPVELRAILDRALRDAGQQPPAPAAASAQQPASH